MPVQIIISDFVAERRMVLTLDNQDFADHARRWMETDPLLLTFKDHPFFAGCTRWCELTISQMHVLVVNMLKICASQDADVVQSSSHPLVARLSFILCSLIKLLQSDTGSVIDLIRVNRVGRDDVVYDYCARLDVTIEAPRSGKLRVVLDNA